MRARPLSLSSFLAVGATVVAVAVIATAAASSSRSPGADTGPASGPSGAATAGAGAAEGGPAGAGTPVHRRGGRLAVGTHAELDGLLPSLARWGPAGLLAARAVFDPLTALDEHGVARPYLAESLTPDGDAAVWTLRLRPDVEFQDGSPLTADAVVRHLDAVRASPVTGAVLAPVAAVVARDPLTVELRLRSPWPHLPLALAGQVGFVASPDSYERADGSVRPVGTGPFGVVEWRHDDLLALGRNPRYWQADGVTGEALPYLDLVELHPVPDGDQRMARLRAGQLDVVQTDSPGDVDALTGGTRDTATGRLRVLSGAGGGAASIVLNCQSGPFADRDLRVAAAQAVDRPALVRDLLGGRVEVTDGPFSRRSPWGNTWSSLPPPAPAWAAQQVRAWTRAHGGRPPEVRLVASESSETTAVAQRVAAAWTAVGFSVALTVERASAASAALLTGDGEAFTYRAWERRDPDQLAHFWLGDAIARPGDVGLNLARYASPLVDDAVLAARAATDVTERQAQYQRVWDDFAVNVPVLWLYETRWALVQRGNVLGLGEHVLPTGERAEPVAAGAVFLTSTRLGA